MGKKRAKRGHNVNEVIQPSELKSFVARIERLNENVAAIVEDRKEVYVEAKSRGFDTRALRTVIRERQIEPEKLREFNDVVSLYRDALSGTPLGDAADEREESED